MKILPWNDIIIVVVNLPGGFHLRKGVVIVNTYEEFMVIINVAALIVAILTYVKRNDKGTIRTTGLAGGLLTPYKGSLPALESKDSPKKFASRNVISY